MSSPRFSPFFGNMLRQTALAWGLAACLGSLPVLAQPAATPVAPGTTAVAQGAAKVDLESWKRMTPEERNAERERLRGQWQQMSPAERQSVRQNLSERLDALSPEQRQEMRQQLRNDGRSEWQKLTPEERQSKREAVRERWQAMPPAERQQLREQLRERHAQELPPKKEGEKSPAPAVGRRTREPQPTPATRP